METVRWLLQGRPTFDEWQDAVEREQQALIAVGYYERRWVAIPTNTWVKFSSLTNTVVANTPFTFHGVSSRPWEVRLTARPSEITEFEQALRALSMMTNQP